jgi:hypothetical protein
MYGDRAALMDRAIGVRSRLSRPVPLGLIITLALGLILGFGARSVLAGPAVMMPWQDNHQKFHTIALGRLAPCKHPKENADQEGNCRVGAIFRNDGSPGSAIARFTAQSHRAKGAVTEVQCSAVIPSVPRGDASEAACTIFARPGEDLDTPLTVEVISPARAQELRLR